MRHFVLRRIAILVPSTCAVFWLFALYPQWAAAQQAPAPKLSLKDAEVMALKNHPLVQQTAFETRAAEQVIRETKSAYYPTAIGSITAAGGLPDDNSRISAGYMSTSRVLNREAQGLEVNQLITDFGRTSNLVASSRLNAKAASQSAQQTQQDVLFAVNRAYFGLLRAQALLQVGEQTVKARQVLADQITTLEKNQLRSQVDVAFAEVDLAKANQLLVVAQSGVKAAYADLASALGLASPQDFELTDEPLPASPAVDPTDLVAQALVKRPDLASAKFSYESAVKFARAERDLSMPTISAVAAGGLVPAYQAPLADYYGAGGINVNVPIFNGFLFSARHAEANFRAQAANQAQRDLADRISRDVRVAWANEVTAFRNLDVTAQLLKQTNLALNLSQGRYKLGLSSIVELSEAQLNLTSAQIDNTNAKYDFEIQSAALLYQTGQLH